MKNSPTKEQTYTIEEVRESLDNYLGSSVDRLRARLKTAWSKQVSMTRLMHVKTKI